MKAENRICPRRKGRKQGYEYVDEFCTPVSPADNLKDLNKSLRQNYENFLYIAKNMVYMHYCTDNSTGETEQVYILFPKGLKINENARLIPVSVESITASPVESNS